MNTVTEWTLTLRLDEVIAELPRGVPILAEGVTVICGGCHDSD